VCWLTARGGGLVGCLYSYAGIRGLVTLIPDGLIPREAQIRLNLPVLFFSLGTAVGAAVLFGLAPALQTVRKDLVEPLKDASKGAGGGFRRGPVREPLGGVVGGLSRGLFLGAGRWVRGLCRLVRGGGASTRETIVGPGLPSPGAQYRRAADKQRFYEQLLPRLHRLPGVAAATETTSLPPYGGIGSEIDIIGKTHTEKWRAIFQLCSEGYFPTLQLRTIRGRTLSETEVNGARKVAVVNQTLVNKFFSNEDPVGQM